MPQSAGKRSPSCAALKKQLAQLNNEVKFLRSVTERFLEQNKLLAQRQEGGQSSSRSGGSGPVEDERLRYPGSWFTKRNSFARVIQGTIAALLARIIFALPYHTWWVKLWVIASATATLLTQIVLALPYHTWWIGLKVQAVLMLQIHGYI